MTQPSEMTYARSRVLIPPETRALKVLVVGAGMVGSWTAAALARMVSEVTIVDFDTVEDVNVGVQMYSPYDVGKSKVQATADHLAGLPIVAVNDDVELLLTADFLDKFDVVVSALDSMRMRDHLSNHWWLYAPDGRLWVDVRVMGELVCILHARIDRKQEVEAYFATLQDDSDIEDSPCGAEGTVYSGMFAGARVAAVINNWARGIAQPLKEVWHTGLMQHLDAATLDTEGGEVRAEPNAADADTSD